MGFFAHYTRPDLSFPAKIFNPKFTENGMYQARELSYVFDFVDAHVIAFLVRHRWYYFFPLSHLLAVLGSLACFATVFEKGGFRGKEFLIGGLILLWLLDPTVYWSSNLYFRSAKALCSFLLILLATLAWHFLGSDRVIPRQLPTFLASLACVLVVSGVRLLNDAGWNAVGVGTVIPLAFVAFLVFAWRQGWEAGRTLLVFFVAGIALSLSDQQGYFFMLLAGLAFGALGLLFPLRDTRDRLLLCATALMWSHLFVVFYDQRVTDFLSLELTGVPVYRAFQPKSRELVAALLSWSSWKEGLLVGVREVQLFLFYPNAWIGVAVLISFAVAAYLGVRARLPLGARGLSLGLVLPMLVPVALYVAMSVRIHLNSMPQMTVYYYFPVATFWLVVSCGFVLATNSRGWEMALRGALVGCVIASWLSLPVALQYAALSGPTSNLPTNQVIRILQSIDDEQDRTGSVTVADYPGFMGTFIKAAAKMKAR